MTARPRRIIVAVTGASGAAYGVRTLEVLRDVEGVETHLVVSEGGRRTIAHETALDAEELAKLADVVHDDTDLGASIASGSFRVDGMVVVPCSIKTLSGVATSAASSLVVRAADVCLKDRRPLVLVVRETPLHLGHLRLMTQVTEAGATVFPPAPSMYVHPTSIADLVDHSVMRILDQLRIDTDLSPRWGE